MSEQTPSFRFAVTTVVLSAAAFVVFIAAFGAFDRVGSPSPTPETTVLFEVPFQYSIPNKSDLQLTELGELDSPAEELDSLVVVFTKGGSQGDRGVIVALPAGSNYLWCFGHQAFALNATFDDVLASYGEWQGPRSLQASSETAFDGRPASTARTRAGRCPHLHPWEREDIPAEPGVLTLVDVDGVTVVISIWGHTDAVLDEWLPAATEFVQTIHFIPAFR